MRPETTGVYSSSPSTTTIDKKYISPKYIYLVIDNLNNGKNGQKLLSQQFLSIFKVIF